MKKVLVILGLILVTLIVFKKTNTEKQPQSVIDDINKENTRKKPKLNTSKDNKAVIDKPVKLSPKELNSKFNDLNQKKLDQQVDLIVGDIRGNEYSSRHSTVNSVNVSKLDSFQKAKLIDYLFDPSKDDINENSIKTGLIDSLVMRNNDLDDFGQKLLTSIQDRNRSEVLRDYLLQFVPDYYKRRFVESAEDMNEADRSYAKDSLVAIIKDVNSALSGTALISFKRLTEIDNHHFSKTELQTLARTLTESKDHRNRATAINFLGNSYDDLSILESFVVNDQEHQLVRIAAISSFSKKDLSKFPEMKNFFIEFMKGQEFKSQRMKIIASTSLKRVQ